MATLKFNQLKTISTHSEFKIDIGILRLLDPKYAICGVSIPAILAVIPPTPIPIVRTAVGKDSPERRRAAERLLAIPN